VRRNISHIKPCMTGRRRRRPSCQLLPTSYTRYRPLYHAINSEVFVGRTSNVWSGKLKIFTNINSSLVSCRYSSFLAGTYGRNGAATSDGRGLKEERRYFYGKSYRSRFVRTSRAACPGSFVSFLLLVFTCSGYDWNDGVDYEKLLSIYRYSGFQATNFGLSVEQINKMVRRKDFTIFHEVHAEICFFIVFANRFFVFRIS